MNALSLNKDGNAIGSCEWCDISNRDDRSHIVSLIIVDQSGGEEEDDQWEEKTSQDVRLVLSRYY